MAEQATGAEGRDDGSVVAEWAMVAGLSAILFALTLQLVFALHVRNVLIDSASHGARYGTLADRGSADAEARTRDPDLPQVVFEPGITEEIDADALGVGEQQNVVLPGHLPEQGPQT